jgi:hypothetical protein
MAITTPRTRSPVAPWDADPFHPDGTWSAEWPPEIWLVKWRLKVLGYTPKRAAIIAAITEAARALYVERYGHEPPRRGRRRSPYTIVCEHDRVEVIDEAAKRYFLQPFIRKEPS